MRILLATYWVIPDVGGVTVYLDQLKQHLEARGHQVDLLAHHPEYDRYHIVGKGRTFYKSNVLPFIDKKIRSYYRETFPELDNSCVDLEVIRYSFELGAAYLGLGDYDLIHTQDVFSTLAISRVKPRNTALVATIHGSLAKEMVLTGTAEVGKSVSWHYMSTLEYRGAISSNLTILSSNWLRNVLVNEFGVPGDRLRVIPNGIDTAAFNTRMDSPASYSRSGDNRKVLICPARLNTIKGHHVLIDALAILKTMRNDWVCWIVGDGPNRPDFEQQVDALGLRDHIIFFGERDDVPQLFKQADVFVMPSLQDNFPYAVLEAQVAGKPSVVTDAGGIPEMVIHEETGLVSPVRDASALANNLRRILQDDGLRQRLGETARQRSGYWSLQRMVNETVVTYHDAIHKVKGGV
ncbi:glycosyltransferase family 4 protein [Paenibacillus alkalitolerans]|uniref:glycosyltransferase family 4 protein n=1 Tax=Paenibacillus alkalitolerans TaxID=2799335 RepID=UPI0018F3A992|nr:glycosyltransferase family 4 protein [Paenibacillus alkalitolerans]